MNWLKSCQPPCDNVEQEFVPAAVQEAVVHDTPAGQGGFSALICLIWQFAIGVPGIGVGGVMFVEFDPVPPPQPGNRHRPAQSVSRQAHRRGLNGRIDLLPSKIVTGLWS